MQKHEVLNPHPAEKLCPWASSRTQCPCLGFSLGSVGCAYSPGRGESWVTQVLGLLHISPVLPLLQSPPGPTPDHFPSLAQESTSFQHLSPGLTQLSDAGLPTCPPPHSPSHFLPMNQSCFLCLPFCQACPLSSRAFLFLPCLSSSEHVFKIHAAPRYLELQQEESRLAGLEKQLHAARPLGPHL